MISPHGEWKAIEISGDLFTEADFEGLVEIRELNDYAIVDRASSGKNQTKKARETAKRKKKRTVVKQERQEISTDIAEDEKKKSVERDVCRKRSGSSRNRENDSSRPKKRKTVALDGWRELDLPEALLLALEEAQFTRPTPIQLEAIPPAIRDRRDIVGAAETGSGKTLAFGIPVLHHILRLKMAEESGGRERKEKEENPLYALVLAPTRELALQVKKHLAALAKYTDIKIAAIVGGMAAQKQERLLRHEPEIVVGTPGRLWEMIDMGNPHLVKVATLPLLVIDEADRMIEQGHFAEMAHILDRLPQPHHRMGNSGKAKKEGAERQTFIFSATLTIPKPSKRSHQKFSQGTLDGLMRKVRLRSNPCVVDLTRKQGTVETLLETRITCSEEDKDVYLYYFLLNHPGRTLVFTNTIDCIRRLKSLLALLELNPLPLHAGMQQRQRLKNLDKFSTQPNGLLLASDVAARGLDIRDVDHVIHYQIPKNADLYVHRSGRTARANTKGISIMIVGPKDLFSYKKMCKVLNRDKDLPMFPVDMSCWLAIKERVFFARSIDKEELSESRARSKDNWFVQTAKAMDLDLDQDLLQDRNSESGKERKMKQMKMKQMKAELTELLKRPLLPFGQSLHFPTSSASLVKVALHGSKGKMLKE